MKYLPILMIFIISIILSCTPEGTVFKMETWWGGHWQQLNDTTTYFSSGQKAIGAREIVTPQFFISKNDTILQNFYFEDLVESDHKKRFKLIKTSDDTYIKIQELDESHIDVYGPAPSINELDSAINEYRRLPAGMDPPIPDSMLYDL